ncbi:MAG: O-antigen ligase family protein [Pseudomonadota bacterium]|nr:O-antigen ligase family protein [Pseudomonadota bacterium]
MSAISAQTNDALLAARPQGLPARWLADRAIWFAVFLGGFVIIEPAPYELFLAMLLGVWAIAGMRIPRTVVPLLAMFALFEAGGVISSFQIENWQRGIIYVAVSTFLALSSIFFAIVIREDERRLDLIFRAYVVAALITTLLGLIGYFALLPGFETFTRYSRAMGAFQDPNVYAPFLVAPCLYLIHGILTRSPVMAPLRAAVLMVLLLGLFLAFSRAAWGLFVITAAMFYLLLVINAPTARERLKYISLAVLGVVALVLMLMIALQSDAVYSLFEERFRAVQTYDSGREGRFARHLLGYELALTRPLGIGPLEFGYIFSEDTHNNFVKALMAHGWLGFFAWVAMYAWTLAAGFKLLFRPRPWLPYLQIAYVVFVGHVVIGNVIDTDHWRHFYLMIGTIWGCIALEARWQAERGSAKFSGTVRRA